MIPIINFTRLLFLFLALLPLYFLKKKEAVYLFFKLAGPSFIKLGQILSVRSDLIGDEMAMVLSQFQDRMKPFSEDKLFKILNKEFANNFDDIFKNFDYQAVASASIAQVHKATLQNNQEVAVKILRPNIENIMRRDISTLKLLAVITKIFSPFLSKTFFDISELLYQTSRYELDLLHEAANGSKLRENLKNVQGFYVPQIFWKISSQKILVIEWLSGVAFSDKEAINNTKFDKKKIAENLVISYFNQVYADGFFHADMHPGNLFLLTNGDIGVVDFGIMGKIDRKLRIGLAEILISFLHKEYNRIAELHIELELVPANTNIDDLALSCRKIGEMIVDNDVKDISVAKLLTDLIKMTRDYKMATKPELLLLQKTLLLVEGVGVTLDKNLNMWELSRPWVKEWARTNIGFDAKIRDATIDIFKIIKKFIKDHEKIFSNTKSHL